MNTEEVIKGLLSEYGIDYLVALGKEWRQVQGESTDITDLCLEAGLFLVSDFPEGFIRAYGENKEGIDIYYGGIEAFGAGIGTFRVNKHDY